MLSRTHMRQFLAVVDTGSFTRAANALNIAQPSLSGGIAQLERQLGTRLFVRERRRIGLTAAGNALLPLARTIETRFHEVEARVGSVAVPAKPIRLGVLETVATTLIAGAIADYDGERPLEIIEGSERELASALANGSVDVSLTIIAPHHALAAILLEEDYCLALPAGHPLATAASIRAADVAGETMIARRACEVLGETSRFFTQNGVRPRFALRSDHDDRAMAMVRAGLGVTVAPRSLGIAGVAMVPIAEFGLRRTIGLVTAARGAPDPHLVTAMRASFAM